MVDVPGEVADLPEGGPVTLAALKTRLGIDEGDHTEDGRLTTVILAVNDEIRTWPVAARSSGLDEWKTSTVHGATLLAARIDARRNTPDGVAGFSDGAPIYVQRNDPDVAMLLGLGAWSKPAVG